MDSVMVAFLLVLMPMYGIFWLGVRNERKKMEYLFRLSLLTAVKRTGRIRK